jgi:hypothetical protein
MKTKTILIGILILMTFATYAQSEKSKKAEIKTAVTEWKVETDKLDELRTFDWEMVKEMFQENDAEQEITLAFAYVNKSDVDKTKVRFDNFEIKLTEKKADLDKMTSRLKKSFEKLNKVVGQITKN